MRVTSYWNGKYFTIGQGQNFQPMKTQYTKIVGQIHPPFYPTPKDEESFDKYLAKFTCLIKGFVFVIAFFNIITMEAVRAFNNEVT